MKKNRWIIYLRRGLLAVFLVAITAVAYLHQAEGASYPNIHALCPFGGLESLYSFFTQGTLVSKIFSGTMILFAVTLVLALVFRRSFCGLLCPLGAIQEFIALAGEKIFGRSFRAPAAVDMPLRYLKYVILIVTVGYAWKTAGLWMAPYDPWSAYAHLSAGLEALWSEAPVGLGLLALTVVGSFFYNRIFCKYLCPMGAFYALIGKISPFKVERHEKHCINCQTCVLVCPARGALELKSGKRTIKPVVAILLVLALFFVPIFVTDSLGLYKVRSEKVKAGQTINVSDVRGYMTIREAAEATKIELNEFYRIFKIPRDIDGETKMKEIGGKVPGYDFHKIKDGVK